MNAEKHPRKPTSKAGKTVCLRTFCIQEKKKFKLLAQLKHWKRSYWTSERCDTCDKSDKWHLSVTLQGLFISITSQHHKHETKNVFCLYREEFKVSGSWGKDKYHPQQDCLGVLSSTPLKHITEKIYVAQALYSLKGTLSHGHAGVHMWSHPQTASLMLPDCPLYI